MIASAGVDDAHAIRGRCPGAEAVPAVVTVLEDDGERMRRTAAELLDQIGPAARGELYLP